MRESVLPASFEEGGTMMDGEGWYTAGKDRGSLVRPCGSNYRLHDHMPATGTRAEVACWLDVSFSIGFVRFLPPPVVVRAGQTACWVILSDPSSVFWHGPCRRTLGLGVLINPAACSARGGVFGSWPCSRLATSQCPWGSLPALYACMGLHAVYRPPTL